MEELPLGKTGNKVSSLSLGCMHFGTRINEDTSKQLLDQYFEAGGRFLDTANNYAFWFKGTTGGESEALLGRWMKERRNRDQIFLATKVGGKPLAPGTGLENMEGLSASTIEKAVDGSLRRLGTDYIDLYYAHIDDRETPLEETLAAFDKLVKAGKVRQIGCSNTATWRIEKARNLSRSNGWAAYSCVQQRHSYLRPKQGTDFGVQAYVTEELLDYCEAEDNFSLIAYSPLLNGAYTRKDVAFGDPYISRDSDARMAALTNVANETGATLNQVVLAWMLQGAPTVIPLIGASSREQLQENLDALNVKLSKEQLAFLTSASA